MSPFRRFLGYLRAYWPQVILSAFLLLSVTALTLPYPRIVKYLLDQALGTGDWALAKRLCLLFLACLLARAVLAYLNRLVLQRMGMRITCDLRKDLFARLQSLPLRFFESRQTGQMVARVAEDTGALFNLVTQVLVNALSDACTILAVVALMLSVNPLLTFVCLSVLPFFLLNYHFSKKKLRKIARRHRRNWHRVLGFLNEKIAGARLVKSFGAEQREIQRFSQGIERDFENYNQVVLHNTRLWIFADAISSLGGLLVLFFGGWLVLQKRLSIGNLVEFNMYIGFLFSPMVRLSDVNSMVESAFAALEKIYEIVDAPSFVKESASAQPLGTVLGEVEFKDLSFGYEGGKRVLQGINLYVAPGETVALVGPSGAGKTTLINLLCRFYDADEGAVLLDGQDIRQVTLSSLRQQIGLVLQDQLLWSGSVLENLRYGNPRASLQEVQQLCQSLGAHGFIANLPHGYYTRIGERGVRLSGGQKQRLAIARALLTKPRILIFDEATSALDAESEREVQQAMEFASQGRTTFIIAHRLSTIRRAHKIVVLQGGQIVEQGSHQNLLENPGLYRRLVEIQTEGMLA